MEPQLRYLQRPAQAPHISGGGTHTICSACYPNWRPFSRTFTPEIDETEVRLSVDVIVKLTHDGLLFNASDLYRVNYEPKHLWRVALRGFILTPGMRGILALLRRESLDLRLMKKDIANDVCEHNADVYLHTGFLSLALIDLRLLDPDDICAFRTEVREILASQVTDYYSPERRMIVPSQELMEIASDSEIRSYSNLADCIIELSKKDLTPWIDVAADDSIPRRAPPRTPQSLSDVHPMLADDTIVPDGSLHVIYTSLEVIMAKRSSLLGHCGALEIIETHAKEVANEEDTLFSPTTRLAIENAVGIDE